MCYFASNVIITQLCVVYNDKSQPSNPQKLALKSTIDMSQLRVVYLNIQHVLSIHINFSQKQGLLYTLRCITTLLLRRLKGIKRLSLVLKCTTVQKKWLLTSLCMTQISTLLTNITTKKQYSSHVHILVSLIRIILSGSVFVINIFEILKINNHPML